MRRGDLWNQAMGQIEKELADLGRHDEIALFTFGDHLQTAVGFDTVEPNAEASRVEIVRQAAKKLRPTWEGTDLGAALTAVASELDAATDVKQLAAEPQIIVISDFQKGTRLDALQGFEWPKKIHVVTRRMAVKRSTNAFAQLLVSEEELASVEPRVRVVNAADSKEDQFFVRWTSEGGKSRGQDTAVYVPPGQSRVVKLPRPEADLLADRVFLRGDDHEFDNAFFVVPPRKQKVKILYWGSDGADEQGSQYYLKLATSGEELREVEILPLETRDAAMVTREPPQIVVATSKVPANLAAELKSYVERGGTLLLAPQDEEAAAAIPAVLDDVGPVMAPAGTGEYLLLGEINFSHPLFAPFANPRYSDFTKIHFWKHRSFKLNESAATKVIARFDNGEPALLERMMGKGRILLLASGWHPEESQLALSTKFVPLIGALLEQACGTTEALASVVVGQPVDLPTNNAVAVITQPDGRDIRLVPEAKAFGQTDQPGIYRITSGTDEQRFAVNLAAAESNTAPLEMEQLDQLGVKTGAVLTRAERLDRIRQQRDTELESRQKIWRWLLVGALGVLVVETYWAGRASAKIAKAEVA
jgi:hypothetical protein